MEDLTTIKELASYGGLGIVTLYFIIKDFSISKEMRSALQEFTQVLHEIKGRIGA